MRKTNGRGLLPCIPKLNFLTIKYIFGGGGGLFSLLFLLFILYYYRCDIYILLLVSFLGVSSQCPLHWEKEFEDTKGVIRIRKSKKYRQHNDQKKGTKGHTTIYKAYT